MKKRDLVLDFTSLLDIIMIILFVVISGMGQASLDAQSEAREQMEENAGTQRELEILKEQYDRLQKENNLYHPEDVDKILLYESLMEHAQKITLICTPYINFDKADGNEVEITIYSGDASDGQEKTDAIIFTHNFDLTREERLVKNAEAQAALYHSLEGLIKGKETELVFITVEYTYEDKNFSQTDLNNIVGAVNDIERNYPVKCYIDKIKR